MTKSQRVSMSIFKRIEEKEKAVQTYIEAGDYEKLAKIAKKDDRSISSIIRKLINEYLKTHSA